MTRPSLRPVVRIAVAVLAIVLVSLLQVASTNSGVAGRFLGVSGLGAFPVVTATMKDTLVVDVDADNMADPGDTIRYTAVITNSGTMDAANMDFFDTIDANTTLVPGSVKTTPIARNDLYASIGNVGLTAPAGGGVLANDDDPDGQSISIVSYDATGANGGAISMAGDGSFAYNSPVGYEGVDSFGYTVQDTDGYQDSATVFITVSEVIWFIDNSAGGGGDGRLATPFNSLATFNSTAADEAGDIIFLYETGNGSYSGGTTLLANQILAGQGASVSLASLAGITVPGQSNPLPSTGGAPPVITNSGGSGITLGSNNLLRGLNVGNTNTGGGAGVIGSGVGNLSILDMSITGQGKALDINGGTLNVTLAAVAVTASTAGGVRLNNTGGSATFNALNITTTGGTGFLANNGGTVVVTGSANTLSSTGGPAVHMTNTTIGSGGMTLLSISASGADTGITLNNTGAGDFTVTGSSSTDGSGGTLQNLNDHGIELINAQDVSISNMNLTNATLTQEVAPNTATCTNISSGTNTGCNAPVQMVSSANISLTNLTVNGSVQHGINGNNVTGVTIATTDLTNIGNQNLENGMHFINLLGTVSFNNVSVIGSNTRNVLIENNTGTANMTVSNSTFNDAGSEVGLDFVAQNSAVINFSVTDSTFTHNNSVQLKALAEDSSTIDATITGSDFDGEPAVTGNTGIDLVAFDGGTLTFEVSGTLANPQTFQPFRSQVINIFASGGGTATGRVNGNTILGSNQGAGIRAVAQVTDFNGFNPSITIEIDDNDISGVQGAGLAGIHIAALDGTNGLTGVAAIDATVTDNDVTTTNADAAIQVYLSDLNGTANRVCINATGNATEANGGAFGETDFFFGNDAISGSNSGVGQMQGYAGSVSNTWFNVNGNTTTTSPTPLALGLGPISGGTCATVMTPINGPAFVEDQVKKADGGAAATAGPAVNDPAQATVKVNDNLTLAANKGPKTYSAAKPATLPAMSGESISLSLGTFNPGQITVIVFDVTVDNGIPSSTTQVCNQGLVTADNVSDVLTDDPHVGGSADPTCTPVSAPTAIALASVAIGDKSILWPVILLATFILSTLTASVLVMNARRQRGG